MNDNAENLTLNNKKRPKSKRGGLFVIALFIIGIIFLSRQEPVNTIDCNAGIIASKPDVIMLGAWWCTYCYQAKRYFKTWWGVLCKHVRHIRLRRLVILLRRFVQTDQHVAWHPTVIATLYPYNPIPL